MTHSEFEIIIKEGVNSCANDQGWVNLAELGTYLRQRGLQYGKLSRFLQDYQNIIEIRVDDSITPPAVYARLR
ncbi:MAG: OST-HTH/LOTUS domain-containing protein [Bacteroidales bacterium]|nr:OST-HTH/LOTUS domain-containing protein [Bacteroidales bacterium]